MYRIKKHVNGFRTDYELQKKSIFGFWYNPENIDGNTTGFYDSEKEIREHIAKLTSDKYIEIISV